jgi:HSP20 family protein
MALARWTPMTPMRHFSSLQDEMNRLFDQFFRSGGEEAGWRLPTWAPPVDIYDTEDAVVLTAELPRAEPFIFSGRYNSTLAIFRATG